MFDALYVPNAAHVWFEGRGFDWNRLRKTVAADFVVAFAALVGLVVAVAVSSAPASAFAAEPPLDAGFYSAQVETSSDAEALTSVVDSPCLLEVPSTGQTVARIAWSKNDVVRMIVNDVEYLPELIRCVRVRDTRLGPG